MSNDEQLSACIKIHSSTFSNSTALFERFYLVPLGYNLRKYGMHGCSAHVIHAVPSSFAV